MHWSFFQRARAATQAWLTLIRRCPWHQACGGSRGFSRYWRGRMWSRPNWSTEDVEAMRPSILWNALRGRGTPSLNEAVSCWMASAHSGLTTIKAILWLRSESITLPRNEIRWLGDSAPLEKWTLSLRHFKWLKRTDLWCRSSSSDWAKMSQSSR